MANHKSAEKRHRQSLTKRLRNRITKAALRTAAKKVRAAVEENDAKAAEYAREAEILLSRAATKGILNKKTASRQIGRLAAAAAKASGGSKTAAKTSKKAK